MASKHQLTSSWLVLENGTAFSGYSPSWQKETFYGEVVFNTGMTGYPESLTDPSYAGQILSFTYPLIGNYGVSNENDWESTKIHVSGVVVSEACSNWSHHLGTQSLLDWLKVQNIPIIMGIDTRSLTKILRARGTMLGAITDKKKRRYNFKDPNKDHLVARVSPLQKKSYNREKKVVIAIDCGMKENIVRSLAQFPVTVHRVPYDYDFSRDEYDGIFISNGPGDPVRCPETIEHLKKALRQDKPIFGICLGIQLLALAAGAKTFKLPYGHRGQNQPCIDLETQRCYVTSQNHGYAVEEKTLPRSWKVTFKNLNDQTVAGIAHTSKPFFAVQFHPEAAPGPTDTIWLFEKFYKMLCKK